MQIKKAVIATAGLGTRFFPITKTIQKEMLPVLNRPVIDYVIEDLLTVGVEEIIFVVNEHNQQVLHFYSKNFRLKNLLLQHQQQDKCEDLNKYETRAKFVFIKQKDTEIYGTAIPLKLAEPYLKKESAFFYLMGDNFIIAKEGQNEYQAMLKLYAESQATALVTAVPRPKEELNQYGILDLKAEGKFQRLINLIEKPEVTNAPSQYANISRYIFNQDIFSILKDQKVDSKLGELLVTDTVSLLAKKAKVVAYLSEGEYLDCGNVLAWLKANITLAFQNPEYKRELCEYLKKCS